jgi:hypothetical protein
LLLNLSSAACREAPSGFCDLSRTNKLLLLARLWQSDLRVGSPSRSRVVVSAAECDRSSVDGAAGGGHSGYPEFLVLGATSVVAPDLRNHKGDPLKKIRRASCCFVVIALAAAAATTATTAGAAGTPCTPTPVTIGGNAGLAFCGPATATLTIGGKTYSFQKGFCAELPHSNSFQLSLGVDIGTLTGPNNNGDKPGFSLDIAKNEKSAALAFAYVGGHELVKGAALSVAGGSLAAGTFKGKTTALKGSWNCHGLIDKS